jgi:hypothetical protein
MAMWALVCSSCNTLFPYSRIADIELARLVLPEKPMSSDGKECECPNCGHVSLYLRSELRYRRDWSVPLEDNRGKQS